MRPIDTIETDPQSPFGKGPPSTWIYEDVQTFRMEANAKRRARGQAEEPLLPPLPGDDKVEGTIRAVVNWGRWIVECECRSAQVVSKQDPRFWCEECQPPVWRLVVFPDEAEQIEAELAPRQDPKWRAWVGEPLSALRRESAELSERTPR